MHGRVALLTECILNGAAIVRKSDLIGILYLVNYRRIITFQAKLQNSEV